MDRLLNWFERNIFFRVVPSGRHLRYRNMRILRKFYRQKIARLLRNGRRQIGLRVRLNYKKAQFGSL